MDAAAPLPPALSGSRSSQSRLAVLEAAQVRRRARLQALARRWLAVLAQRRRACAATALAGAWRRFLARRWLAVAMWAVVRVQAVVGRGAVARRRFGRLKRAAVRLQSFARRVGTEDRFRLVVGAATVLQAKLRAWLGRRRFRATQARAVAVQAAWRRTAAVRRLVRAVAAAAVVAAAIRGALVRRRARAAAHAATVSSSGRGGGRR